MVSRSMKHLLTILGYLWALPVTLLGLLLGLLTLLTGGHMQIVRGAFEFWGGLMRLFLKHHFLAKNASAMTLGHVIFGQTLEDLTFARDHEHVHVRQFARWGIFMVPAYLGCSLWLWLRGKNPYFDNPFEKEAYGEAP